VAKQDKARIFYDQYHSQSATQGAEDPVRRRTHAMFLQWLKRLDPPQGCRLLDLSCGLGYFLKAAHEHDPSLKLFGLDTSRFAVNEAAKRVPSARVRRGDAMRLPYADGSFDVVTCIGSLEHYPDSERGLAEISRVLKKGGRAYVYVPNQFFLGYIFLVWRTGETPHEAGQNAYERFETRQGWEEMILRHGLSIEGVSKHNEMYAAQRVSALTKAVYAALVEPWIPLNLSYCFGYWLRKKGGP
jgi:ubiquinone/menaquinone biosynthesis C-methylase UbiE